MYSHQKSLNFGQYVPNDEVLNKKIPENPRYQHVRPAVNTGHTIRRQIDELREKQKNCHHKKDEVFNRIKFANFIELLVEAAKVHLNPESAKGTDIRDGIENSEEVTKQRGLTNVIMGIGEIDLANQKKEPSTTSPKIAKEYPYLLLDVRDKDKYLQCHFKTAKHYPSALLARSIGYETEELKLYKNSSPEVIILYDDDESIAARVATTLMERGYDNVFLLTGGLKYCNEVFPRKPMSTLCADLLTDPSRSSSPTVQCKSNSTECFSTEDIDVLEQYMDYPQNDYVALGDTRSCTSHAKTDKSDAAGLKQKAVSLTYRRNSTSSVGSIDQARGKVNKSAMDSRSKAKKTPWK